MALNSNTARKLEFAYNGQIEDVDAWVCGISKKHVPGSSLGSLFHNIIRQEFNRVRNTDQFYFERIKYFTDDHIDRLETVRNLVGPNAGRSKVLSYIIERNTELKSTEIGENPFFIANISALQPNPPISQNLPAAPTAPKIFDPPIEDEQGDSCEGKPKGWGCLENSECKGALECLNGLCNMPDNLRGKGIGRIYSSQCLGVMICDTGLRAAPPGAVCSSNLECDGSLIYWNGVCDVPNTNRQKGWASKASIQCAENLE